MADKGKGPEAFKAYFKTHYAVNLDFNLPDPLFESCLFLASHIGRLRDEVDGLKKQVKALERKLAVKPKTKKRAT